LGRPGRPGPRKRTAGPGPGPGPGPGHRKRTHPMYEVHERMCAMWVSVANVVVSWELDTAHDIAVHPYVTYEQDERDRLEFWWNVSSSSSSSEFTGRTIKSSLYRFVVFLYSEISSVDSCRTCHLVTLLLLLINSTNVFYRSYSTAVSSHVQTRWLIFNVINVTMVLTVTNMTVMMMMMMMMMLNRSESVRRH